MRIALVNDYSLEIIGGATASMFEQKKALEAAGHEVFILQLSKPKTNTGYDETNVIYIKPTFIMSKAASYLPILFAKPKHDVQIKEILKKHRIDLIHCQSEMTLAHLAVRNARALGIPAYFTVHTIFWQYLGPFPSILAAMVKPLNEKAFRRKIQDFKPTGNAMERLLKNTTLSIADQSTAVLSPSLHQKRTIEATTMTRPVHVVPNPFSSILDMPGFVNNDGHAPRFVWVGRCVSEKRPLDFLEGVKKAAKRTTKPFVVDIVGDGELLEEMIQKYSNDYTTFHGHVPHAQSVALIDQGDMVCISSYHFDNQPMIIAEAVSRYRGVLYCDERLTEGTQHAGYLTTDETSDSIADAIVDLVEHPEKIAQLSRGAKKDALIFAPETFVKTITEIYRK